MLLAARWVDLDKFLISMDSDDEDGSGTTTVKRQRRRQQQQPISEDKGYLRRSLAAVSTPPRLPSEDRVDTHHSIKSRRGNRKEDSTAATAVFSSSSSIANLKLPFPWKLYQLLEEVESMGLEHIISWMDEKSFRVHSPEDFVAKVMPKFFRMSKFQSFTRQCKWWGYYNMN